MSKVVSQPSTGQTDGSLGVAELMTRNAESVLAAFSDLRQPLHVRARLEAIWLFGRFRASFGRLFGRQD